MPAPSTYGFRAKIGLIVPPTNTVNEGEWARMVPDGVTVHTMRMALHANSGTPEGKAEPQPVDEISRREVVRANPVSACLSRPNPLLDLGDVGGDCGEVESVSGTDRREWLLHGCGLRQRTDQRLGRFAPPHHHLRLFICGVMDHVARVGFRAVRDDGDDTQIAARDLIQRPKQCDSDPLGDDAELVGQEAKQVAPTTSDDICARSTFRDDLTSQFQPAVGQWQGQGVCPGQTKRRPILARSFAQMRPTSPHMQSPVAERDRHRMGCVRAACPGVQRCPGDLLERPTGEQAQPDRETRFLVESLIEPPPVCARHQPIDRG